MFGAFAVVATALVAVLPLRWHAARLVLAYVAGAGVAVALLPLLDHYY